MRISTRYKLRLKRRRLLFRAWRKRNQLSRVRVRVDDIAPSDILAFVTLRNEMSRLPFFLDYYRKLGVSHFLIVDNGSDDGSSEFLKNQSDVSLWSSNYSYKLSRFGMDWLTCLQYKYGAGHWCLTVDADEIFVYPDVETKDLTALTGWLDMQQIPSFGAIMLDMYPKGPVQDQTHDPQSDPMDTLNWFDAYGYFAQRKTDTGALWVQGGVRARSFFNADLRRAPTLNKTPLVKWDRSYVYMTSTHSMLPSKLNQVYDTKETTATTGVLLHTKFLPSIVQKSAEEKLRKEHFENSDLYEKYYDSLIENPDLWSKSSCKYKGPEQLEQLGLMFRCNRYPKQSG